MPKVLTDTQIASYADDGFLFPIEVCSPDEAAALHGRFEDIERTLGEEPQVRFRVKAHLPFPWLCDLVGHPRLLDAVEDLIGPDILCWGASFFTKKVNDARFISWHTDSFYYGFDPAETLTAWFSFNDATPAAGCVRYIPGSHRKPAIHDFKPDPDNLAGAGQTARDVDESRAVDAVLRAGQAVFHHESVVHHEIKRASFTKKVNDARFISWHTDSFYYGFDPAETLTAWFSFNDATPAAGCVRYIPGSHRKPAIHDFKPDPDNLAGAGQTARDVDESRAVDAVLRAGQAAFHHESVVHGSRPNRTDRPRVGFSIHYCAPHVRETRFDGATALLLRGKNRPGHWAPDPTPKQDFDPDCIQAMLDYRKRFKDAARRKVIEGVRS